MQCIFCKIANKEIKADIVKENESIVAFPDINPKAALHLLIVPKKHIESVDDLKREDKDLAGELFAAAKEIAREKKLEGYKLVVNVGKKAGQTVGHLHLHLLSGRISEMP